MRARSGRYRGSYRLDVRGSPQQVNGRVTRAIRWRLAASAVLLALTIFAGIAVDPVSAAIVGIGAVYFLASAGLWVRRQRNLKP